MDFNEQSKRNREVIYFDYFKGKEAFSKIYFGLMWYKGLGYL